MGISHSAEGYDPNANIDIDPESFYPRIRPTAEDLAPSDYNRTKTLIRPSLDTFRVVKKHDIQHDNNKLAQKHFTLSTYSENIFDSSNKPQYQSQSHYSSLRRTVVPKHTHIPSIIPSSPPPGALRAHAPSSPESQFDSLFNQTQVKTASNRLLPSSAERLSPQRSTHLISLHNTVGDDSKNQEIENEKSQNRSHLVGSHQNIMSSTTVHVYVPHKSVEHLPSSKEDISISHYQQRSDQSIKTSNNTQHINHACSDNSDASSQLQINQSKTMFEKAEVTYLRKNQQQYGHRRGVAIGRYRRERNTNGHNTSSEKENSDVYQFNIKHSDNNITSFYSEDEDEWQAPILAAASKSPEVSECSLSATLLRDIDDCKKATLYDIGDRMCNVENETYAGEDKEELKRDYEDDIEQNKEQYKLEIKVSPRNARNDGDLPNITPLNSPLVRIGNDLNAQEGFHGMCAALGDESNNSSGEEDEHIVANALQSYLSSQRDSFAVPLLSNTDKKENHRIRSNSSSQCYETKKKLKADEPVSDCLFQPQKKEAIKYTHKISTSAFNIAVTSRSKINKKKYGTTTSSYHHFKKSPIPRLPYQMFSPSQTQYSSPTHTSSPSFKNLISTNFSPANIFHSSPSTHSSIWSSPSLSPSFTKFSFLQRKNNPQSKRSACIQLESAVITEKQGFNAKRDRLNHKFLAKKSDLSTSVSPLRLDVPSYVSHSSLSTPRKSKGKRGSIVKHEMPISPSVILFVNDLKEELEFANGIRNRMGI